jgi:hypothetical protein
MYHFIRECVENGKVEIEFIRSEEQLADVLHLGVANFRNSEPRSG